MVMSHPGEGLVGVGVVMSDPPPPDHVTYPMMHLVSQPPPLFSDRMTDACKNITFARYATRAVNIHSP